MMRKQLHRRRDFLSLSESPRPSEMGEGSGEGKFMNGRALTRTPQPPFPIEVAPLVQRRIGPMVSHVSRARGLFGTVLFAALCLVPIQSFASTFFWVATGGSSNWNNSTNWASSSGGSGGAGVPGVSDRATFDGMSATSCNIDIPVSLTSLTIDSITAGGYLGSITTNSNAVSISGGFSMSTGTFNAMGSTITVNGDWTAVGGMFNAGTSSITVTGNTLLSSSLLVFNSGSSTVNFAGIGKTLSYGSFGTNFTFWNLMFSGTISALSNFTMTVNGTLNIPGTLTYNTINQFMYMNAGSTVTISGTITNGGGGTNNWLGMTTGCVLGTGGTIGINVGFTGGASAVIVPARTYNGLVSANVFGRCGSSPVVLGPGSFNFSGGLLLDQGSCINPGGLDASVNNPTVAVATLTISGVTSPSTLTMGSSVWTIGSIQLSSGTLNANTSSMTVTGDVVFGTGTFNAGGSTMTIVGNFIVASSGTFNYGTGLVSMTGSGVSLRSTNQSGMSFFNLNVSGSVTVPSGGTNTLVYGLLNVPGSFQINTNLYSGSNSTITVSGTLSGSGGLSIYDQTILSPGGALNVALVTFRPGGSNQVNIPARTYSQPVVVTNTGGSSGSAIMLSGTHTYNSGITVGSNATANITLDASINNPTISAQSLTLSVGASSGVPIMTMGAGTMSITGGLTISTGTFNAATSSITVSGDVAIASATFNGGGSTITVAGNWSTGPTTAFNSGSSTFIFTGTGKSFQNGATFWNLSVPGSLAATGAASFPISIRGLLSISGSLNISGTTLYSQSGSTATVTGTFSGPAAYVVQDSAVLTPGGTITVGSIHYYYTFANVFIPARTYSQGVILEGFTGTTAGLFTLGAGVHNFTHGLSVVTHYAQPITIDASVNNPTIGVTTIGYSLLGGGVPLIKAGTGVWTVTGNVTLAGGQFSQATGGVFKVAGTSAQTVESSSGTFYRMEIDNALGVTFPDSLTVSTFSATQASSVLTFAPSPSSMTVTGFLELNGQSSGSRMLLQSSTPGSVWKLKLGVGTTQVVAAVAVQDSNASGGLQPNASDNASLNLGNNTNWIFGIPERYWIALSAPAFWSDPNNWALTPFGPGNHPPPTVGNTAVFDSASSIDCNVDVGVNVSSLTVSTSTLGGYQGHFITNDNPITVANNLLFDNGTFNAGASVISIGGTMIMNNGTFNANTSSITVTGDTTWNAGVFNANGSTATLSGNLTMTQTSLTYVTNSGTLNLSGAGKTATFGLTNFTFGTLNVSGTISTISGNTIVQNTLTVSGSIALGGDLFMSSGSTATITPSGTISGSSTMNMQPGSTLGTTGTLSSQVRFSGTNGSLVPARTYNGLVIVTNALASQDQTILIGPGSLSLLGGLQIQTADIGRTILDGSVNNPTVNVSTLTFTQLLAGVPTLNAGGGTWTIGSLALSSGTLNANSATITFSSSVVMSSGTFNAGTSSMTVAGDLTLNAGVFNGNASTLNLQGNLVMNQSTLTFNPGTSIFNLNGTGKTADWGITSPTFWALMVPGTISTISGNPNITSVLNVSGSLNLNAFFFMQSGSSLTITSSGTVSGAAGITLYGGSSIGGTGGTLSAPVTFFGALAPSRILARTYNGAVTMENNFSSSSQTLVLSSGTFNFAGGLSLISPFSGNTVIDAATNSPTVSATSVALGRSSSGQVLFNIGSGTWTVSGDWDMRQGQFLQSAGVLTLNGTGLQHIYSSSATYYSVNVQNTGGVVAFQDSLTVSTFTALLSGATVMFAVDPSSLTVNGFLKIGPASGAQTLLRSTSNGISWGLKTGASALISVHRANVKDSDASGGTIIPASDGTSIDSGNNTNWAFTSLTRYWVANGGTALWSNPANWSFSSGGAGGIGAPQSGDSVVFDGNGTAACTMDVTPATISSFTVNGVTAGGYIGTINTSSAPITIANGFTLSTGTFNAMGSTLTVNGDFLINAGIFNANASSITISGNVTLNWPTPAFNSGTSFVNLIGSGKTFNYGGASGVSYYTAANLQVTSSVTTAGVGLYVSQLLNVPGTLTLAGNVYLLPGSTTTITGIINGSGSVNIIEPAVLGTGGILNAVVNFATNNSSAGLIPARTYGGAVNITGGKTLALGAGTINFAGGLKLTDNSAQDLIVDASLNNPTVNVSTITYGINPFSGTANLNAGTGVWTVTGPISVSTCAAFNGNAAQITFANSLIVSTGGIFNANSSSITVVGDVSWSSGTFNMNSSTVTLLGNVSLNDIGGLNYGTGSLNFAGSGKTLTALGAIFSNMAVPGSYTFAPSTRISLIGRSSINGSVAFANSTVSLTITSFTSPPATLAVNGTLSGGGTVSIGYNQGLTGTGPISTLVRIYGGATIAARTFSGNVQLGDPTNCVILVLSTGSYAFNGGLSLAHASACSTGLDASVNNPNVTVSNLIANSGINNTYLNMGSGLWTVTNTPWDVRYTTVTQSTGGILRFNGTAQQALYSSSATYVQVDDVNLSSGGLSIQDSLTVSSFTALQAGSTIQFAVLPSSLTVLSNLGMGAASGAHLTLRSASPGTQWGLVLSTGATQSVRNVDTQDSNASGGLTIQVNDVLSVDSGNNVNWTLATNRYWVASGAGNWNSAANWSATSGGPGGASVPTAAINATFDHNGLGTCTMNVPVSVNQLILSTATAGSFTGTFDTSNNSLTVNSFIQNNGTFNANNSSITINGDMTGNAGTFNAGGSTSTVYGNFTFVNTAYLSATGFLRMLGPAITWTANGQNFWNVSFHGLTTVNANNANVLNSLIVDSTITLTGSNGLNAYGPITILSTGAIAGTANLRVRDGKFLGTSGTLSAPFVLQPPTTTALLPARVYGNNVNFIAGTVNALTMTLGTGTIVINGALSMATSSTSPFTIDGTLNNPNVILGNGIFFTGVGTGTKLLAMGAGNWALNGGNWDMRSGTFTQSPGSVLTLAGSSLMSVYSSSGTYGGQIAVTNTGGVTFKDSLTVSAFTAQQSGETLTFAPSPSTFTVQQSFSVGASSGTKMILQSASPGTAWGMVLNGGASQSLTNLNVRDSNASGGITLLVNDGTSVDSGNNTNWNFGSKRYWVSSVTGNWSNPANWATGSGGTGGSGAPTNGFDAVFDANGLGSCNLDVPLSIGSLIISTSIAAGYSGQFNTGGNVITLSGNLTINNGSFKANSSSITLGGNFDLGAGASYTANTSILAVSGSLFFSPTAVFADGSSSLLLNGNSQTFTGNGNHLATLTLQGSYTVGGTTTTTVIDNYLSLAGTTTLTSALYVVKNSTFILTGVLAGTGTLVLQDGVTPGAAGILASPLTYRLCTNSSAIPARVYAGLVTIEDCGTQILAANFGAGSFLFNSGLSLQTDSSGALLVDASVANPSVVITTFSIVALGSAAPSINAGGGSWTISNPFTLTSGSSFNANTSSTTWLSDVTLASATFNAGGSTQTVFGNWTMNPGSTFVSGTSALTLAGTSKTLTTTGAQNFNLLTISGNVLHSASPYSSISGSLNVPGTLTLNQPIDVISAATATISGTLNSSGSSTAVLDLEPGSALHVSGTLNSSVTFRVSNVTNAIPAGTYGGLVSVEGYNAPGLTTLQAGSYTFNGGLQLVPGSVGGTVVVDAATNNPTVNVGGPVTLSTLVGGSETLRLGTTPWSVAGDWDMRGGTFIQPAGGQLQLSGSAQQKVYSAKSSYAQLVVSNASSGGVLFEDALTVASFTAVTNGQTVAFATNPSSMTVTAAVSFGPASGKTTLRSVSNGTRWGLLVSTPAIQSIHNADVKDSDASGGTLVITDSTSIDSGNNLHWLFNPVTVTSGNMAPASAVQGSLVAMSSFTVSASANATFTAIQILKAGPAADRDVQFVRIYRESGATPGFQPLQDILVVQTDNNVFTSGAVTVPITNSPLQTFNTTPVTYYVVYVLNPTFIGSPNEVIGSSITTSASLTFVGGSATPPAFPIDSTLTLITKLSDTMTVVPSNLLGAQTAQGTNGVPIAQFNMSASRDRVFLEGLTVTRLGNGLDSDLNGLTLWQDTNGDGILETGTDAMLSSGNDVLFGGTATIAVSTAAVDSNGGIYFLSANVSPTAPVGDGFGFLLGAPTDFVLLSPDVTSPSNFPFETVISSINPSFNTLTLTTGTYTAPATLQQGATAAMQLLTFTVDSGNAIWNSITLGQIGTVVQNNLNSVTIYRDNGDLLFQPGTDALISVSTVSFNASGQAVLTLRSPETVFSGSPKNYWVVVKVDPAANVGATVQIRETNPASVNTLTTFTQVNGAFPLVSGVSTITPTIGTLLVTPSDLTPPTVLQGATEVGMLKLTLATTQYTVGVLSLRVDRAGTGSDSDVAAIKIYKDDGDGLFEGGSQDVLLTSGRDVFSNGRSTIFFNSSQLINTSSSTYFVSVDFSGSASIGRTVGLTVADTSYFAVTTPNVVAPRNFPMPTPSAPTTISKQVATVQVSSQSVSPVGVDPNTPNLPVLELTLSTNRNIATLTNLQVGRVGGSNADVPTLQVYFDSNNNGVFEAGIDQPITALTSFDSSGQASMALTTTQTLTTVAKHYFVVVNVSASATPGDAFSVRFLSSNYLTVTAPDLVSSAAFPFQSNTTTVNQPPSTLTFTATDLAPINVSQDTPGVVMASFTVVANRYSAQWTQMRVDRTGSGVDGDVSAVKLYVDDGDGIFNTQTDSLVSSGLSTFVSGSAQLALTTQTITTTPSTYWLVYDVAASASSGKTLGASITSSGFFSVVSPSIMGATHFPFVTKQMNIIPTIDTMTLVATNLAPSMTQGDQNKAVGKLVVSASGHAVVWNSLRVDRINGRDTDIASIALYADSGDGVFEGSQDALVTSGSNFFSNGSAFINFNAAQTIGVSPKTYFMVVSLSTTSTFGDTLEFNLPTPSYVTVTSPKSVASTNFPILFTSGGNINKLPDVLTVGLSTAATSEVYQGSVKVALAKLTLRAARDQVSLSQLRLSQYGTGGDGDLSAVYLYADTANSGVFEPGADALVAPQTTLAGGVVTFLPSTPVLVTNSSQTYFVVGDIAPTAVISDSLGFRMSSTAGTLVISPDSISTVGLPTQGPLLTILDPHVPRTPQITINSTYSSSPTRLSASWISTVPQGQIIRYDYAIGTTAGGTDVQPFTSAGVETSVTQTGLLLTNGLRYYFSVRALSDANSLSATAVAPGILVDAIPPTAPTTINTFADGNSIVVTWSGAGSGPSGIGKYYTFMRAGSEPRAVEIGTTTVSSASQGLSSVAAYDARSHESTENSGMNEATLTARTASSNGVVVNNPEPGTYFFSVQTVSNAGLVSPRSAETQILFGVSTLPDVLTAVTNYPNPFDSRKGVTTINYELNQNTRTTVTIYDVFGGKVKSMSYDAGQVGGLIGSNNVTWDGTDGSGSKVSKGIYLATLQTDATGGNSKKTIKIGVIH